MELDFENRPERRDYDVRKSFRKWINPAMVAYLVVCMGLAGVVSIVLPPLTTFYALLMICILFGFPIILGAAKKQDAEMTQSHHGYNVQENETKPFFWFGETGYKKYRKDTGGFQGMMMGYTPYHDKLDDREQRQREMPCEDCGTEPGLNGGYFIEHRKLTRVLGFSVSESITETEAYCNDHKPEDFV